MVGQWTLTPRMLVRIQTPEPDPFRDRLMVGQQNLNLLIKVRVLVPEPTIRDSSNGRTTVSEAANRSSNLLSRTSNVGYIYSRLEQSGSSQGSYP